MARTYRMSAKDALTLLEETRHALAAVNADDPGIQAALTIGWDESSSLPQAVRDAGPREWSPRPGGALNAEDIRMILEGMLDEIKGSDRSRTRDEATVGFMLVRRAIETMKKGLAIPDRKFLKALAVQDFKDTFLRKPVLR